MSPALHKILNHGATIIEHRLHPIGQQRKWLELATSAFAHTEFFLKKSLALTLQSECSQSLILFVPILI